MNPKIYAASRAKCKNCGASSFPKKRKIGGFFTPICFCGGEPSGYRLFSYFPDPSKKTGKARTGAIRHTDTGERITDAATACYMLKQIEKEIENGDFNPDKYTSQANRKRFLIGSILPLYVWWSWRRTKDIDNPLTRRTAIDRLQIAKNHLRPLFGHMDIQHLNKVQLKNQFSLVATNRRRVHEELATFFKFAKEELGIKFDLPKLPPKPGKVLRDESEIPDIFALEKIANEIKNPASKAVAKLCGLWLLRPSDILPLKRGDLDLNRGIVKILRHESRGRVERGRKSALRSKTQRTHTAPLVPAFFEIMKSVGVPQDPAAYLFQNKARTSHLPYSRLQKDWGRARLIAAEKHAENGFKTVQLYMAAKHAAVVKLIEMGRSHEEIIRITGITKNALEHYARVKAESFAQTVIDLEAERRVRA